MMAMKTTLDKNWLPLSRFRTGTPEENAKLDASYEHLCKMRDELVTLNIVPAISEWSKVNPNL
jgi:malate dehydrogenase